MGTLIRVLRLDRVTKSPELLFAYVVVWWGIAFLPRILPDLVWALDGTDATDFEIFADASFLAWSGRSPYDVVSCFGCAYRYSPLFAYLFLPFAVMGATVWLLLHIAALAALPLRIAKVLPFLWPFWWDVGVGSNLIFLLVLTYHALKGRAWAIYGVYVFAFLAPRPLMLPIVGWLLWQQPRTRVPFIVGGIASIALAVPTGHVTAWIEVLASSGSEIFMTWNVAPSAFIGGLWPLIGVPLAVVLVRRGYIGLAALAASPYWIPYYLLLGLLPRARSSRGHASPAVADERIALFDILAWLRGARSRWARPRLSDRPAALTTEAIAAIGAPVLIGTAIVLDAYIATAAHPSEVIRPILVVAAGAATIGVLTWTVVRRPTAASAIASLAVLALLVPHQKALIGGLLIAMLGVAAMRLWLGIRQKASHQIPPSAMSIAAAILVGVTVLRAIAGGVVALDDFKLQAVQGVSAATAARHPNIYVVLLDGYPRADDLASDFGYDPTDFETQLATSGFRVHRDASSLFRRTELVLASSMLRDPSGLSDPEEFHAIAAGRGDFETLRREWRSIRREYLSSGEVMDQFRSTGYYLTHVASPVSHVEWGGWDHQLDAGQLTDFEASIVQDSLLAGPLGRWVMEQQRGRLTDSLLLWATSAHPAQPSLTFAHVMAPHAPFLYGPGGRETDALSCWYARICSLFEDQAADLWISEDDYRALFRAQVDELNRLLVDAVKRLVREDPSAIVVLMSDHGVRYTKHPDDSWNRTFFAIRAPQAPNLLSSRPGPDGIFPRLLDWVLRTEHKAAASRHAK